jgi:hypothetical protein
MFLANTGGPTAEQSGAAFLSSYFPAIDDGGQMWFYVPAGGFAAGISFILNSAVTGLSAALTCDILYGFDTTQKSTLTFQLGMSGSSLQAFTGLGACWFRPTLLECTAAGSADALITQIQVGTLTGGTFASPTDLSVAGTTYWDLPEPISEESTVTVPWSDTRATAAATLFINTTSVFNKEGRAQAVRCITSRAECFRNSFFTSQFQTYFDAASQAFRYSGPLEKGFYVYSKPDAASQTFRDWCTKYNGAFRFNAFDYVDIVKFVDHSYGGSQAETNLSAITNYHIEFRNSSVLWTTSVTRVPLETWRQAVTALTEMPNFYENPTHFRSIIGKAKQALQWAGPIVAPYARGAAKALAMQALGM